MAMSLARSLITKPTTAVRSSIFTRAASSSPLLRLRPLLLLSDIRRLPSAASRGFSTRSLDDHWLIVLEKPDENMTRDDIIDSYIKTAAKVIGSEEEARKKIYSVSTKHYFAFGVIVTEEDSNKFEGLPGVRWVLPDLYLNVRDYGGEPFINGQADPYGPKYHEEWVRNNAKANERSRRNDRPRNQQNRPSYEDMPPRGPPPNAGYSNVYPVPPRDGVSNMGYSNNVGYAMPPNPNMQNTPPICLERWVTLKRR